MKKRILVLCVICAVVVTGMMTTSSIALASPGKQGGGSTPPEALVKLIFIHHSTGENWLTDGYGNLGLALEENNYYVSDTNYGWGPESIGDRTDIPDWEEWFRSGNTETYMDALFNEAGQHADYTRTVQDPGGENQIIMFKSCFPNSDLEGSPDDPPSAEGWLSVGHAKYVYNQILNYFGQHPEKLFVVITAPPLSDRGNAANARAFNLWLLNDWLAENDYPYQNVAVFDFYNVLTGSNGHHTFEDGQEVYEVSRKDTLAYPSGDDHPSKKGSQKATEEFVPLLNYFYNRWQAENPSTLSPINEDSSGDASPTESYIPRADHPKLSGLIDDFESEAPAGTNGWEAYQDEGTPTVLDCGVDSNGGSSGNGLRVDYHISAYSWATCGLYYDQPQDWSDSAGLAFMIYTGSDEGILHVDLFVDGPDGQESYVYELSLEPRMREEWVQIGIVWDNFKRVDWEEDAGAALRKEDQISGLAFGFGTEDNELEGVLWIDNVGWMIPLDDTAEELASPDENGPESENQGGSRGFNLPCIGSLALPVGFAGVALIGKEKLKRRE